MTRAEISRRTAVKSRLMDMCERYVTRGRYGRYTQSMGDSAVERAMRTNTDVLRVVAEELLKLAQDHCVEKDVHYEELKQLEQ